MLHGLTNGFAAERVSAARQGAWPGDGAEFRCADSFARLFSSASSLALSRTLGGTGSVAKVRG